MPDSHIRSQVVSNEWTTISKGLYERLQVKCEAGDQVVVGINNLLMYALMPGQSIDRIANKGIIVDALSTGQSRITVKEL